MRRRYCIPNSLCVQSRSALDQPYRFLSNLIPWGFSVKERGIKDKNNVESQTSFQKAPKARMKSNQNSHGLPRCPAKAAQVFSKFTFWFATRRLPPPLPWRCVSRHPRPAGHRSLCCLHPEQVICHGAAWHKCFRSPLRSSPKPALGHAAAAAPVRRAGRASARRDCPSEAIRREAPTAAQRGRCHEGQRPGRDRARALPVAPVGVG